MYLYTRVPQIRIHTGYHFPVISFPHWHLSSVLFYITCIFPVIWAYPNVNQHFSSKSQSECPSACPVLFRFQQCQALSMLARGLISLCLEYHQDGTFHQINFSTTSLDSFTSLHLDHITNGTGIIGSSSNHFAFLLEQQQQ